MSSSADGDDVLPGHVPQRLVPLGTASTAAHHEGVGLLQAVQDHFCFQPPHYFKGLDVSKGFSVPLNNSAPLV